MSKNALRKRRDKARHRDQWGRFPKGTPLGFVVRGIEPMSTPLMDMLIREGSR